MRTEATRGEPIVPGDVVRFRVGEHFAEGRVLMTSGGMATISTVNGRTVSRQIRALTRINLEERR